MTSPVPSRQSLRLLARLCMLETKSYTVSTSPLRGHNNNHQRKWVYRDCRHFSVTPYKSATSTSQPDQLPSSLPDITNFYTLFPQTLPRGPPGVISPASSFSIPISKLRSEFLRLQSQHHPDKFPPGTTTHQKSLALSSLLNNAYKTLCDPLLRAQYLLQLNYDIDVTSEDNSAHPTDQSTLMEVMEAQERIEEAQDAKEIEVLKEENTQRIQQTVEEMAQAFEKGNAQAAKDQCVKLKYWRSLKQGLDDWEEGKEVRLIH